MAVKSSGALSFNTDIVGEFGGTAPHSLSEYKRNGSLVPDANANSDIPTTNSNIQFSDYYGSTAATSFSSPTGTNLQEINAYTYLTGTLGWDGSSPVTWTIPSDVWIWSDSTSTAALTIPSSMNGKLTIINNGKIIGKGGRGSSMYQNAESGGPAITNNATGVTLTNNSGAYIAGGGGGGSGDGHDGKHAGGGGGAGGGDGGGSAYNSYGGGGAGGAIGQAGSNGSSGSYGEHGTLTAAGGGGAGGGGGAYDYEGSDKVSSSGGGGGRILPGTGGSGGAAGGGTSGGAGGSAGNAAPTTSGAGGGGGWGAAGRRGDDATGSAGSGGAAIAGTAIATYTNNGTVYGSTA